MILKSMRFGLLDLNKTPKLTIGVTEESTTQDQPPPVASVTSKENIVNF